MESVIPGPRGSFLLGSMADFIPDPPQFLRQCAARYGPVARFRLATSWVYLVSDPALIEEVLVRKTGSFVKDEDTRDLSSVLGKGLLTSEGGSWKRHRRLLAPPFQAHDVAGYAAAIGAQAERMARVFGEGEERDVSLDMKALTLGITANVLFGTNLEGDVEAVGRGLDVVLRSVEELWHSWFRLLPRWTPVGPRRRVWKETRRLDEVLYRMIEARRAAPPGGRDVLSILLGAVGEDGSGFTTAELRDESMTLLLAGHETTALALTYALFLLASHPSQERRLCEEMRSGREEFLDAVVRETLRLYPPAWTIGREATEAIDLGGHRIPEGAQIWLSQWVVHRDARWFPEPDLFRPERWLDGLGDRLPRFAYFPFGGGPRTCIGNHFAVLEMKVVLRTLLATVSFALRPGRELRIYPSVTLRPVGGVFLESRRAGGNSIP